MTKFMRNQEEAPYNSNRLVSALEYIDVVLSVASLHFQFHFAHSQSTSLLGSKECE